MESLAGLTTEGQNSQPLQDKFNNIIKEAEVKLLDATMASLKVDEQQAK